MAGNIKIIEPKENFQKVSKDIIFNEDVDFATLGIYVKVLALGKKWQLNINGLSKALGASTQKIKSAFALLEKLGYLKRIHAKDDKGHFVGFDYHIGCTPFPQEERTNVVALHRGKLNQPTENPTVGKSNGWNAQRLDGPTVGKSEGINRYDKGVIDNTKNQDSTQIIPPTPQQVVAYVNGRCLDPEGFALYYIDQMNNNGWKHTKTGQPIRNWKSNVLQWLRYHSHEDFSYMKPIASAKSRRLTAEEIENLIR